MPPIVNHLKARDSQALENLYRPIEAEFKAVGEGILKSLASGNPFIDEMAGHLTQSLGKRVRSALALLSYTACREGLEPSREASAQARVLAEAVELLHNATLIHDDIIDNSPLRRGVKTLNAQWGNEVSVLMGDMVFARVFVRLAEAAPGPLIQRVAKAANLLCEGEILEVKSRFLVTLDEAAYLEIAEKKTASLIALACEGAAMAAGQPEPVQRALAAYGLKVGTAFQIADDLLDLEADAATLGKPRGHDLLEGKMTLPAILALARASKSERAAIQELLLEEDVQHAQLERVVEFIRAQGGVDLARRRAQAMVDEARGALAALPMSPSRQSLEGLAGYFVERHH